MFTREKWNRRERGHRESQGEREEGGGRGRDIRKETNCFYVLFLGSASFGPTPFGQETFDRRTWKETCPSINW